MLQFLILNVFLSCAVFQESDTRRYNSIESRDSRNGNDEPTVSNIFVSSGDTGGERDCIVANSGLEYAAGSNNIADLANMDLSSCCDFCKGTSGCQAFGWSKSNGSCFLKSATFPKTLNPDTISGYIAAPPQEFGYNCSNPGADDGGGDAGLPGSCPADWDLSPNPAKCFRWFSDAKTPDQASEYCKTLGGNLATVKSAEENTFIVNNIHSTDGYFHFGGRKDPSSKKWFWADGFPMVYMNWASSISLTDDDITLMYYIFPGQQWHGVKGIEYIPYPERFICELLVKP